MPGGFAPRFAIEAGFLVLLGVGAGIADLRPAKIVAILAGGWLIVSLVELAVWRAQSRPAAAFVPPPAEPLPEAGAETEAEPEPVHGWPAEEEPGGAEDAYPLRADAGDEPSGEVEAYTRVLEGEREEAGEAER
jgi:hypothetical protein